MSAGRYARCSPLEEHRDHLFRVLGELWPKIARGQAEPDEYGRYWTLQSEYERVCRDLQRGLLEQPGTLDPADPWPLCPACVGIGYIETTSAGDWWRASPYDPPEYDPIDCPSCGGIGTLAPPYGRPQEGDEW